MNDVTWNGRTNFENPNFVTRKSFAMGKMSESIAHMKFILKVNFPVCQAEFSYSQFSSILQNLE